jgi:hypothetical protein
MCRRCSGCPLTRGATFKNGVADHAIKLCWIYVSRSVLCEFWWHQFDQGR